MFVHNGRIGNVKRMYYTQTDSPGAAPGRGQSVISAVALFVLGAFLMHHEDFRNW